MGIHPDDYSSRFADRKALTDDDEAYFPEHDTAEWRAVLVASERILKKVPHDVVQILREVPPMHAKSLRAILTTDDHATEPHSNSLWSALPAQLRSYADMAAAISSTWEESDRISKVAIIRTARSVLTRAYTEWARATLGGGGGGKRTSLRAPAQAGGAGSFTLASVREMPHDDGRTVRPRVSDVPAAEGDEESIETWPPSADQSSQRAAGSRADLNDAVPVLRSSARGRKPRKGMGVDGQR